MGFSSQVGLAVSLDVATPLDKIEFEAKSAHDAKMRMRKDGLKSTSSCLSWNDPQSIVPLSPEGRLAVLVK